MKISIGKYNNDGCFARIVATNLGDEDEDVSSAVIVQHESSRDFKKLCKEAARELREAALRFELLADFDSLPSAASVELVNNLKIKNI